MKNADCTCRWEASPISLQEPEFEELSPHMSRLAMTKEAEYVREIKHTLDKGCPVHKRLLMMHAWGGTQQVANDRMPLEKEKEKGGREGYEVLVEENGVVSRQTVRVEANRGPGGTVSIAREIQAVANDRAIYDRRKSRDSNFYTPLDSLLGEGHCRSCHHICAYEHEWRGDVGRRECQEPICGHSAGCPSC